MLFRELGRNRLKVSAVGLGCMGMSEFYGDRDEERSLATILHALHRGVTHIDTADMYGPHTNELLVCRAIKAWVAGGGARESLVVATKFGIVRDPLRPSYRAYDSSPGYVKRACEASLKRLGVQYIDLYYQHRVDPQTPIEETVGAMVELKREGKIRHIGLSEASAATIRRAAKVATITAVQSEYSLWSRDYEADVLPTCRELGIGFVAYAPLGRGFLTGRIQKIEDLPADDFRRTAPRFLPENFQKNLDLVEKIKALATRKGCTPGQLAIAWVLAQGDELVAIPGTRHVERLEENLGSLGVTLSAEELRELDMIAPRGVAAGERFPPSGLSSCNR